MPRSTRNSAVTDERLTQLIRLKRLERPDAEFWQAFEQEFRSRQLSSFVRVQPWHTRLRLACMMAARRAAPPAGALGAIGVALLAVTNTSYLAQTPPDTTDNLAQSETEAEAETQTVEKPLFVVESDEETEEVAHELESLFQSQQPPVYPVNSLTGRHAQYEGLRLMTSPVTYSRPTSDASGSAPIGAKVIKTKR